MTYTAPIPLLPCKLIEKNIYNGPSIRDADGKTICDFYHSDFGDYDNAEENAKYFHTAVNSYADLVEALRLTYDAATYSGAYDLEESKKHYTALEKARATLAKAGVK